MSISQVTRGANQTDKKKIDKDKPRWDPISISYTELFPKLVRSGHIEPVQFSPLRPPFPRWYNAHTRCDYHDGNPGHPTENCTSLKSKVQKLINDGKLTFEDLDGPAEVKNLFRVKVGIAIQEHGVPREASLGKPAIPKDEVSIAKDEKEEANSLLTTKGSKAQLCGSNIEEEGEMLQCMMRKLELMLKEQKEYVAALREEYQR